MKFALFGVLTDTTIGPVEFAAAAEAAGFESIFLPEHTHAPVDQRSQFPLGGDVPEVYRRTLDPTVALAAAATATTTLRLGTGVSLVLQHDVITQAKQIATLDVLSGGRVLFGVGAGWNLDELRNHGLDPAYRMPAFEQRIRALQSLWADEIARADGRWTAFDPLRSDPKPLQRPYPPMLLGGSHRNSASRAARLTSHWFPNVRKMSLERLGALLTAVRVEYPQLRCSVFGVKPTEETVVALQALNVERCVIALPDATREECLRRIERYAPLVERFGVKQ